jgi:hypothetical protein
MGGERLSLGITESYRIPSRHYSMTQTGLGILCVCFGVVWLREGDRRNPDRRFCGMQIQHETSLSERFLTEDVPPDPSEACNNGDKKLKFSLHRTSYLHLFNGLYDSRSLL